MSWAWSYISPADPENAVSGGDVLHPARRNTNNVAEWWACGSGVKAVLEAAFGEVRPTAPLLILGDSLLVINQLTGKWRVNKPHLAVCRDRVWCMLRAFPSWNARWIPREENSACDGIAERLILKAGGVRKVRRG